MSVKGINDDGNSKVSIGDKIYYDMTIPQIEQKVKRKCPFGALEEVPTSTTATIQVLLLARNEVTMATNDNQNSTS